jgi:thiamine-monophosphate kinase
MSSPLSEFDLIAQFFAAPSRVAEREPGSGVAHGVGDDAAILNSSPGHQLVVTSDTMVAGVHFFSDVDPEALGYKLAMVNLSDLAAMGAQPRWALLNLTLETADAAWLEAFARGLHEALQMHEVALVGGDTTRGPMTLSLALHGEVPSGQALLRTGAQVGDRIGVSGPLGGASYSLRLLQTDPQHSSLASVRDALERPQAQVVLGQRLRGLAHSCIDISDGLLADLGHVLRASGVGAQIDCAALPLHSALVSLDRVQALTHALTGGEDYQLLFTYRAADADALALLLPPGWQEIGTIVASEGVELQNNSGVSLESLRLGYDHFRT